MEEQNCRILGRKTFSRCGWAVFTIVGIALLSGLIVRAAVSRFMAATGSFPVLLENSLIRWAVNYIPIYGMGFPVGLWILHTLPENTAETKKIKTKDFVIGFIMCYPFMVGGGILSNLLAGFLTNGKSVNNVVELISENDIMNVLTMVILAPVLEELFFRKFLIDRTRKFGEKNAVFFSALAFGLFHCNLYQFFYAFGIGLIFGYIYLRTHNIRYSMLMHLIINFMSGVIGAAAIRFADPEFMELAASGDARMLTEMAVNDPHALISMYVTMVPLLLLNLLNIGLAIAGTVLLGLRKTNFFFLPADCEIVKGSRIRTIYCNPGVITFLLVSIAGTVGILIATCY